MPSFDPHRIKIRSPWVPTGRERAAGIWFMTWRQIEETCDTGYLHGFIPVWHETKFRWRRAR